MSMKGTSLPSSRANNLTWTAAGAAVDERSDAPIASLAGLFARTHRFPGWIWKSLIAGLCGAIAHTLLIYLKSRAGWLPSFQPYQALQATLHELVGSHVPTIVPWAISYVNSMTVVGFLFGSSYRLLPGRHGITKGFWAGVLVWLIMGAVFFPLVGLGLFAWDVGQGIKPTLFSFTMVQAYSSVMGKVFALLNRVS
jgi:Family of unknown function (DUF6789)